MTKRMGIFLKTTLVVVLTGIAVSGKAQHLRTSYFMDGATNKSMLNPALRPPKGYLNLPAVGAVQAATFTNTFAIQDIIDMVGSVDDFTVSDQLFDRLKQDNWLDAYVNTDIISFGFYKGKGFWSGNIGVRADIGASIPKSKLEYMRYFQQRDGTPLIENPWEESGSLNFDIMNESVNVNLYTEVGIGYSHRINKVTIGAKVKMLFGVANMKLDIKQMGIEESWDNYTNFKTKITRDIKFDIAMAGVDIEKEIDPDNGEEFISDLDFNRFGFAGYGAAIDVGLTYRIARNFTISGALIDLGFISWQKKYTQTAGNNRTEEYSHQPDGGQLIDFVMMKLTLQDPESRRTNLASTVVFGAEWSFADDRFSTGILSTTRLGDTRTISEVTFSTNFRPVNWLDFTLSYSLLQTDYKTFGLGLRMGPVFIGSDYIYTDDYQNTKALNAYVGISIPLGRTRYYR